MDFVEGLPISKGYKAILEVRENCLNIYNRRPNRVFPIGRNDCIDTGVP